MTAEYKSEMDYKPKAIKKIIGITYYYIWEDSNIHDFLTILYIYIDELGISGIAGSLC